MLETLLIIKLVDSIVFFTKVSGTAPSSHSEKDSTTKDTIIETSTTLSMQAGMSFFFDRL